MEFLNATRMTAGCSPGLEPSGRELLVVVVKGTFVLPQAGEAVRLAEEQAPLALADRFTGEPGLSAPLHEADFAPRKPSCDVLLTGHAQTPEGRPMTRLQAGLRVGTMEKVVDLVGDRVWQARRGATGITPSAPHAFTRLPVSYDRAFGGVDRHSPDPAEHGAYALNPVGRGWHRHAKAAWVDGSPMPNVEAAGQAVQAPGERRPPVAFGPVARGWPQRACHAGTYDDAWLRDVFPFLPADFDERYYQAAPDDQRIAHPRAPLDAVLTGFTADGPRRFALPCFEMPVQVFPRAGGRERHVAVLDTVAFEPDHGRFTLTWRVARPLRKGPDELAQVVAGERGRDWWQRRGERPAVVAPPAPAPASPVPQDAAAPATAGNAGTGA